MISTPSSDTSTERAATADEYPEVAAFVQDLRRQEAAAKAVQNYRSDLACFGRWFAAMSDVCPSA
jgi:hypothetical protein